MSSGESKGGGARASDIQRSTSGHIRSLLLDGSQPTFLLGAGASVTSGIPAAEETAERAARWAWSQAHGRAPEDIRILRSDYWPWLCKHPWFSQQRSLAEQYPTVIERLLGVKKTRREFFEKLISPGIQPSIGYRSLARILNEGWISTVLTTNFDHCIDDAKILENKPHLLVSIKTPNDLIRFNSTPADPQLIYLHGSVEHYSDKNLSDEVAALDAGLIDRLSSLLRDRPIVVVGYRGGEASIMHSLFRNQLEATNRFAQGLYWCVRTAELESPLAPMVLDLATAIGTNFQMVPIKGFDELFEQDLWKQAAAAGAQPIRRGRGFRPIDVPPDMRALSAASVNEFDSSMLFSRLTQYAKRLGLRAPDSYNDEWLERESRARNLVAEEKEAFVPTVAGFLLFARSPQARMPRATVIFRARGPSAWIARCFGEDAAAAATGPDGTVTVEQEITGNLWAQLDALTDLIALANQGFRLKEEISRTAYPFAPVAIKEVLVNALVHRDYGADKPITVSLEIDRIEVLSPGGLVAEVAAQTDGQNLEEVIAAGSRGIKGYRNPVISDLFYGGGQMDRAGSGLSDVWRITVNNNAEVHFGPDKENRHFRVVIFARPEAVDEITNTATPLTAPSVETIRYTGNLLPIDGMPKWIWHAGTTAASTRTLFKQAQALALPTGYVQDGRFFTLYDLELLAETMVTPFEVGDIERLSLSEAINLPNGENIILKLLNDSIGEHLRALGLFVEFRRRKAYFRRSDEGERKITYKGRVRRATRTVVKARTRRDSPDVLYYEHKAMGYSVLRFAEDWAIAITPGYAFTRDGEGNLLGNERINVLSTKRAARDFNSNVHHDVVFWAATLSEEAGGSFALRYREDNKLARFGPTIVLSSRLPTISFNSSSLGSDTSDDGAVDAELEELQDELAALAEQPEETPTDESIDDH